MENHEGGRGEGAATDGWRRAGVPDRKFVKYKTFSQRSLELQFFWYLSLRIPVFAITVKPWLSRLMGTETTRKN